MISSYLAGRMSLAARVLVASSLLAGSVSALAQADDRTGLHMEAGLSRHAVGNTNVAVVGAYLPWAPGAGGPGGSTSFAWDVFVSQWHAPRGSSHRNYVQLGVLATWRYRFAGGTSPWFADAGIGPTVFNHVYRTPDREFSTAFQFMEVLALGRSFGERGQHEVSLRLQHVSNGSIKKPNPGENSVRLRYLYRF